MEIIVKILRFDPSKDEKIRYETYEIDISESAVILDVLNEIKWKFDGSLTYRRSCRHGICGSCAVKVNKKNVLACKTRVKDIIEEFKSNIILIEPLSLKVPKIIKDLVIDKKDFWNDEKRIKPYLISEVNEHPKEENIVKPEDVEKLEEAENCIACGCCYYECATKSENNDFIGPMALAKAFKFVADIRDKAKKERLKIVNELGSGVWDCVKCQACIEVCPKDVNPFTKITNLHNEIFKEGVAEKNVATKHAEGFVHSIKKHGILDEGMLVLYSEGVNVVRHLPEALSMFKKGKIKLPWEMPKSEKLEEIQKLIEISQTHELKG